MRARFPNKKNKDENYGDKYKRRRDEENKGYKEKGKEYCYITKEYSDYESNKSQELMSLTNLRK